MTDIISYVPKLEALLFAHGEPISYKKIEELLEIKGENLYVLLDELKARLQSEERGISLLTDGKKAQLVTKSVFGVLMEKLLKEEISRDLTPASVEALSIIAYLAPVSRSRIEYIRGVHSSFILRNLMIRGLIERVPDPSRTAHHVYLPTLDLWRHLGIRNKEELPEYEKFVSLLSSFVREEKVS